VQHYNKAVASFDSRILPSARKFTEMGISTKKTVEHIDQVEIAARNPESQGTESPETPQQESVKNTQKQETLSTEERIKKALS